MTFSLHAEEKDHEEEFEFMVSATTVSEEPVELETMTVTATRTQRTVDEVSVSVNVLELEQIEEEQPQSLDDLLQDLPNVEMTGGPRRVSEKPIIRGLSDKRILVSIDGARQNFQSGHKGSVFLEADLLKSVEVLKSPASALYGSDALGGVIAIQTKDASDFLNPGQTHGFRVKTGYQSANLEQLFSGAVYGMIGDQLDYFLYATQRKAEDIRQGGGELLQNSGDEIFGGLLKLTWGTSSQTIRLTLEDFEQKQFVPVNTEIEDSAGISGADRVTARNAYRLKYEYENPHSKLWNMESVMYQTNMEIQERRRLDQRYDQIQLTTSGFEIHNTSHFGKKDHFFQSITYGLESYQDLQKSQRNGENLRFFPESQTQVSGLFIQDEILLGTQWEITTGVRYDLFRSEATNVGESQSQSQISPKISISYQWRPWLRSYVNYAHGFRAPHIQEMYISGLHFGGNPEGIFVPNPDLEPESAINKEIGFRMKWEDVGEPKHKLRFLFTYFQNHIDQFIESTTYSVKSGETVSEVTCTNSGGCLYFENKNIRQGILSGYEGELVFDTTSYFTDLTYSQVRGENEDGEILGGLPADKWVVNVGWKSSERGIKVGLKTNIVTKQDRIPEGSATQITPGYVIYNSYATWKPTEGTFTGFRLDMGIDNLTDETYRKHLSQLNEAGRNIKTSLTYQY